MPVSSNLPGLDRLIAVCQQHLLPLKLSPPLASIPQPGELVFGEPFDPQLAAAYQRLGFAEFGPLTLFGPDSGEKGLIPDNEELRKYHGTVPRLANSQGLQPVVHIDCHEGIDVFPIASSVDRFFYLYSRYLELLVADPGYGQPDATVINFPWGMTQLITRDEPLMEQVLAGRFDFLVGNYRDGVEWLQQLRAGHL